MLPPDNFCKIGSNKMELTMTPNKKSSRKGSKISKNKKRKILDGLAL